MGSAESSEGRRVSFGMDEEERVRVLQGIRLSDHVVNRMKDSGQLSKVEQPTPPPSTAPSSAFDSPEGKAKAPEKECKPPSSENSRAQKSTGAGADLLRRYEQEQTIIQDEIYQLAKREREAATKHLNVPLQEVGSSSDWEKQKSAHRPFKNVKSILSSGPYQEGVARIWPVGYSLPIPGLDNTNSEILDFRDFLSTQVLQKVEARSIDRSPSFFVVIVPRERPYDMVQCDDILWIKKALFSPELFYESGGKRGKEDEEKD
ncbi:MICOS complex subunit MIC25 [Orycteropus afer afer]|uniref:MICOS complex subunit MIC25 n=1 Tax=Orycteropus afer afer TaxID=1230840 RepID=A0AC54ZDR5_ORYAF|nr:MICOS complex subunit MIC25 [Orycteropus afer afer]